MTRAYTREEVREQFLRYVWGMIEYWENEERQPTSRQKLEGLAHSFLVAIDGESADLPAFLLIADPNSSDIPYLRDAGENYWPLYDGTRRGSISGSLHDGLFPLKPEAKRRAEEIKNAMAIISDISVEVGKQQYSNALSAAHDLCKELHRLWAYHVRNYQNQKGSE